MSLVPHFMKAELSSTQSLYDKKRLCAMSFAMFNDVYFARIRNGDAARTHAPQGVTLCSHMGSILVLDFETVRDPLPFFLFSHINSSPLQGLTNGHGNNTTFIASCSGNLEGVAVA